MVKIALRKNVGRTVDYFLRDPGLSEQEKVGHWVGQGAQMLGLVQRPVPVLPPASELDPPSAPSAPLPLVVTAQDFRKALQGRAPDSASDPGRKLVALLHAGPSRRAAWDVVISPHKSVSVAALCLAKTDPALPPLVRAAFLDACDDLLLALEALAHRNHGHRPDIPTGNLLAAAFTHHSSRRHDPQLHAHLIILNTTRDPRPNATRPWYALETLRIYKSLRALGLVFHRELLRRLRQRGLDARLMTVDGLPCAVLPAVLPSICSRLSSAHRAIVRMTRDRWLRSERTPEQKRQENLLNDRCRPPKLADPEAVAAQQERFERALSRPEALALAAKLRIVPPKDPPASPASPRPEAVARTLAERIRESFHRLGGGVMTGRKLLLAAARVSLAYPTQPFQPFVAAIATWNANRYGPATDDVARQDAEAELWSHLDQQAFFAEQARARTAAGVAGILAGLRARFDRLDPPDLELEEETRAATARRVSVPPLSSPPPPGRTPPRAGGRFPSPGGTENGPGTVPGSAPSPVSSPAPGQPGKPEEAVVPAPVRTVPTVPLRLTPLTPVPPEEETMKPPLPEQLPRPSPPPPAVPPPEPFVPSYLRGQPPPEPSEQELEEGQGPTRGP